MQNIARAAEHIRYQPDDPCPPFHALGVALQGVMISLTNTALFVTVAARAGGLEDGYLAWAVFAALVIGGVVTALQACRFGRLGAGHLLMSGAGPHFIAVAVIALAAGGVPMLASLIVVASLMQFALSAWLPLLRRIVTPVVCGTALMLIAVTVMSIAFERIDRIPADAPPTAGPVVAAVTLAGAAGLAMRASGLWRLWAVLIALAAGSAASVLFGIYDWQPAVAAAWLQAPDFSAWQGLDLSFGADFWALLPMFLLVSLVVAVKMSSDGVFIQQMSRRRPQATDFRLVQGAVNTNGLGTLLAGLAGTLPTIVYTASNISLIELTGNAARRVGLALGGLMIALAFLPKAVAVLLTIPSPVIGAFLLFVMGRLFVQGMRMVFQEELAPAKALTVGVAVSLCIGLESSDVLAELLAGTWAAPLSHGMTLGLLTAILLTWFLELSGRRGKRLETSLAMSSLPDIDAYLKDLAARIGWNHESTERLRAAGEETLACLLQPLADDRGHSEEVGVSDEGAISEQAAANAPRLIINARPEAGHVEMEFLAVFDEENLEDRLAYLSDQAETPDVEDLSFRLLRRYAAAVRHRKYHGIDVVAVQVAGSR